MTISYQFNVHTATFLNFAKLLCRWRGSVYKFVVKEILVFASLYGFVSAIYRWGMDEAQRRKFENVARHIGDNKNLIPLTFVLGFYVNFIVGRWWDHYVHNPWPDRILNLIVLYVNGTDDESRLIRRTLARWTCLSTVLLLRGVSVVAKKRFPSVDHVVAVGLMNEEEKSLYENFTTPYAKYWLPMLWFTELVKDAKKKRLFSDPFGVATKHLLEEVATYKTNQWKVWSYDWISVPLVYTQAIALATYSYFLGCIFSRQFLDPSQQYEHFYVDFYFPAFAFLQFFFYMGWLKVAESLMNPWGEDDDDFEVNWFIDRHVQVSFLVVDEKFGQIPPVGKDVFWNATTVQLPYTSAADMTRTMNVDNRGSASHAEISPSERSFLPMDDDSRCPLPTDLLESLKIGHERPRTRRRSAPTFNECTSDQQTERTSKSDITTTVTQTPARAKPTFSRLVSAPAAIEEVTESEYSRSSSTSSVHDEISFRNSHNSSFYDCDEFDNRLSPSHPKMKTCVSYPEAEIRKYGDISVFNFP